VRFTVDVERDGDIYTATAEREPVRSVTGGGLVVETVRIHVGVGEIMAQAVADAVDCAMQPVRPRLRVVR